jgi:hypothetical protein
MPNDPTVNIDKFTGIRNKQQSRRLAPGSLVIAENVDVDNDGGLVKRQGSILSLPASSVITAAFSTRDQRRTFIIDSGLLKLVNEDLTTVVLGTGFSSEYVYWLEAADFVLMSTGHIIDINNQVNLWRVPNPETPVVSHATGDLMAGQYQLVITYVDSTGREGGASDIAYFDALENASFSFTPEYNGYSIRAYVSDANGSVMYFQGEYASGGVTVTSTSLLSSPIDDNQLNSYPAPEECKQLAFFESSVYTAAYDGIQTAVFSSQPFWWNLFDLRSDHLIIPGRVTVLHGSTSGLVIGTDDEIYVYTAEGVLTRIAEYGVPAGRALAEADDGTFYIHTNQGLCKLFPFENLTEDKLSLAPGDLCYTEVIEDGGYTRVVTMTDGNGAADNEL